MSSKETNFKQFIEFLGLPEIRIFWILLPLLVAIFILVQVESSFSPKVVALIVAAILTVIGGIVFLLGVRLARVNFQTRVERNGLKNIVTTIDNALIVYDQNFRIIFFNPAAEKLFKVKSDEILGLQIKPQSAEKAELRLLTQVVFPSLAPTLMYRSKAGQYPQVLDISFDDPLLELRVTTSTITDERGHVAGFLKVIADRTQEAALMKSKNEFITVASHQLRTPMTEINWALDTIAQDTSMSPGTHDLVTQTSNSAKKILSIIEDLLSIAKIEEGHFGYDLQAVDLVQFLDGLLSVAYPQIERAGLKLYFDRPKESLPMARIDLQKLSMVIRNLIDNGVRYNVPNGQVTVRIRRADDPRYVEISIKDTGIGIPSEEIKNIFTKFFRASNAVKFYTDGSGLGLWIARNIIRSHGGEMWAESEVNRGTTFFFTLPLDPDVIPDAGEANTGTL